MSIDWSNMPEYVETFLTDKIGDTSYVRKPERFTMGIDLAPGPDTINIFGITGRPWDRQRPLVRVLREERERLIQQWEAMTHRNWVAEQRERTILENYLRLQDMIQAIHEVRGWGAYVPRP